MRCGAAFARLGVVIVCLTRRHLTRPKCLKELQWALHLSDQKMLSVIFFPLYPACTYDGMPSLLKHKVVYVSQKKDADCCLFALREVALDFPQRYQLEHIGDQKAFKFHWPRMNAAGCLCRRASALADALLLMLAAAVHDCGRLERGWPCARAD